jgi:hypothetical protein
MQQEKFGYIVLFTEHGKGTLVSSGCGCYVDETEFEFGKFRDNYDMLVFCLLPKGTIVTLVQE